MGRNIWDYAILQQNEKVMKFYQDQEIKPNNQKVFAAKSFA